MNCFICNKPLKFNQAKFCSHDCRAVNQRALAMLQPNAIDGYLRLIINLTGGQIPQGALTAVGNLLGLSRERVRQRANKLGYVPPHDVGITRGIVKYCSECKKEFLARTSSYKYCSDECRRAVLDKGWAMYTCAFCGYETRQLISKAGRSRLNFCTKRCQGRWLYHNRLELQKLRQEASSGK